MDSLTGPRSETSKICSGRSQTPPASVATGMFALGASVKRFDSVDSILDRIDAELSDIKGIKIASRSLQKTNLPILQKRLSGIRSFHTAAMSPSWRKHGSSSKVCISGAGSMRADDRDPLRRELSFSEVDDLSSVDSEFAKEIDKRYKDILEKKQTELGIQAKQSACPHRSQTLPTDAVSVKTHEFETAYKLLLPNAEPSSHQADSDSSVTPRTEDFEAAFRSTLVKTVAGIPIISFPLAESDLDTVSTGFVKHKLHQAGTASLSDCDNEVDTYDEMSDLEQDRKSSRVTGITISHHYDAESESEDGDITAEIREESCRIQKEMELERKTNSNRNYRPQLLNNNYKVMVPSDLTMVSQMTSSNIEDEKITQLSGEKLSLLREIDCLHEALELAKRNVSLTEQQVKANQAEAEEARSQLMLTEFKRETALRELNQLSAELESRRENLQESDNRDSRQAFGLSKEELSDLLSERNQLRALLDNRSDNLKAEKADLERELSAAKEELFAEQKRSRLKIKSLEESVDNLNAHLDEMRLVKDSQSLEKESARVRVERLAQQLRVLEQTSQEALREKSLMLEEHKEQSQRELLAARAQLGGELAHVRKLLKAEEEQCSRLSCELNRQDEVNRQLRDEVDALLAKAEEEEESHDRLVRDLKKRMTALETEKNLQLEALQQRMELNQLQTVEESRELLEQRHEEELLTLKDEFSHQIAQQQVLVVGKEEEICLLRSRLAQQEESLRKQLERSKAEGQAQLELAVQTERQMWDQEHKYMESQQLKQYREETDKQLQHQKEHLEAEQKRCEQMEERIKVLKAELEEQRHQNQRLYSEKLEAVSRTKEAALEERNFQLEKIRQTIEENTCQTIQKIKADLAEKEGELASVKLELANLQKEHIDINLALEKLEKMVVSEINDECRKTANVLGVTPRKATLIGFHSHSGSPSSRTHTRSMSRSLAASAIANMRACNEEMRNHEKELKEEIESLKLSLHKTRKSKDAEMEMLRKKIQRDQSQDMDELRSRLSQVQNGRLLLGNKHDQYLRKSEKKPSEKVLGRSSVESGLVGQLNGPHDLSQSQDDLGILRQNVQDRVRQLRSGSPSRRTLAVSSPDLSIVDDPLTVDSITHDLEHRVKVAELKAQMAEERANRNAALLNHKLHEVNQLQNTLNSQTKEIISLERSFEDLKQSAYTSPSKHSVSHSSPH